MDWTMLNGQRVRKSLGLRDWQAAQRRAREMESEGITSVGHPVTVRKATDDFEKDAETNIQPSTLKQYKILFARLNRYCEQHGYIFLKQLGVVQLRDFRNSWTSYSPRTASKHIERLKRFFSWCVENHWLELSPAKPLKSPKVGESDVVPFTEDEVGKILKACQHYQGSNRTRLIVLTKLMLATGLRISDAVTISKSKIVNGMVELRTLKTGTSVACPIQGNLAKSILALDGEHPFWTGKSDLEDRTKNWRKIYTRVFQQAGVDGTPHQFRHTFAKRLLIKGTPIGYVASLLGNTEQVCRKNYAKWLPERQNALNKAVKSTWS
jgi:site-specific recombinase XerD